MPKQYEFATLESVLQAFNEGRAVSLADIRPSLHNALVWQGYYGMSGGYVPDDDSRFFATNKRQVIDSLCESARAEDDYSERAPAGFRRDLMQCHSAYSRDGNTVYEIARMSVREFAGE
jgi:hypothetical protein